MDTRTLFLAKFPLADEEALSVYLDFVAGATTPSLGTYRERHHILPKSLFPEFRLNSQHPWNQKGLSAEAHFKAHYLLWRVMPEDIRLVCAWKQMRCNRWGLLTQDLLDQYAEAYGDAKKVHAEFMRFKEYSPATREKMSASAKIKVFTEDHKKRMSEAKTGHRHTEETKRKIKESNLGLKRSEEARQAMTLAQSGRTLSPEHRRKLGEASTGRVHTEEAKRKISEANTGKQRTEDFKQRMSELAKGRTHSEETRRKIGDLSRGRVRGPMSEETKRKISEAKRKKAHPTS